MQIQLAIASPKVELPGLTSGIEQLKELKGLLAELRQVKPVEVKIGVSGIEKIGQAGRQVAEEMTTVQKSLIAQLNGLNGTGAVEKLKGGFKDVGSEIEYLTGLFKKLQTAQKATPASSHERRAAYGNTMNVTQLRIDELQAAQVDALSKKNFQAAESDDQLTKASKKNAKAMSEQDAVVTAKAKKLDKLAASADKATASEEKLTKESKKSGGEVTGANGGSLLTRKFVTVKGSEDEKELVSESRQGKPGQVFTETKDSITETVSSVEQLKHSLAGLQSQYQARMRQASQMGSTEKELAQITRQHGDAILAQGRAMESTTAGRTAMQQGETLLRRAAEMDAKAGRRVQGASGLDPRSFKAEQKRERDNLRQALSGDTARHEEEIRVGKASLKTDSEKITMLNQKALAYRQLQGAAREAGEHDMANTLGKRAASLESDAIRLGNVTPAKPKLQGADLIGSKFAELPKTLATVTLWMGAYTAFFQGMKLLETGIEAMVKYDAQTAQLQSVMRGTREEASGLRDTVLGLAVATGRSGEEAMDAAIRWSRLGLSQKEVAMATEISLKSASISGLTAEQSTEQLSGMVASWGLTIPQLNSAFEQMNAMAIRFNASDKELMSGLARTGALAHQMGMDLSQAMSLVSLISGTTGRPGSEAGNALKRYMTQIGKPAVQEKLAVNYGVKISNDDGSLKSQRELLGELSLKYRELDKDRQQDFVNTIAGAQQANRLAIVLQGLTKAQALEVEGLMDFNRADIENKVRRDTMEKDLNALSTAWGRFWISAGEDSGAIRGLQTMLVNLEKMVSFLNGPKRTPDEKVVAKWAPGEEGKGFFENDEQYADRMKKRAARIDSEMQAKKKRLDDGTANWLDRQDAPKVEEYFKDRKDAGFDENQRQFMQEEIHLENLKAKAQAYHAVLSNMGQAKRFVQNNDLKEIGGDLEHIARGAFPEDPKARYAFTQKMRDLEAAGDKEGIIAMLAERQAAAKAKSAEADKAEQVSRDKIVKKYDEEIAANEKLMEAKLKAGVQDSEFLAVQKKNDELDTARLLVANGGSKFTDTDEEGIAPSGRKEVMQGRMRGIEGVFGAFASQPYEVDKIKREKVMIQQKIAALKDLKLTELEKTELETELRVQMKSVEGREAYASLQDRVVAGGRLAHNTMARAAVGRNEPEMQRNEIRVAEASGMESSRLAQMDTDRSVALGRVAEVEAYISSLKEMQITNEERRARMEADITNEKRRQNEEAAKALLMATHEDQLRAALTQRHVERSGHGFSADQFQFMSQGFRQSVERYNPNALPPEYMNHLRELKREKGQADSLGSELPSAVSRLESALQKMPQFQLPSDKGGQANNWSANMPPQFNFSFGDEFKSLANVVMEGVKRPLQAELSNIRSMVFGMLGDQGVAAAQAAGQI